MSCVSAEQEITVYEAAGGMPFFERLVAAFYEGLRYDPVLRPLYPDDDMDGAQHRLTLFLAQYWGGPTTYMEERGHPMLRARHMPFEIGPRERDHWLLHMAAAVERETEPGPVRDALMDYFVPAAEHLRNDGLQRTVPPT
ncbi:MAG: globin [Acidimicrobiaceae bacterium]|nr:globin [Ilumatobacter sp.]MCB9381717.1 globin [Acidimicrobiaceae bacterium]